MIPDHHIYPHIAVCTDTIFIDGLAALFTDWDSSEGRSACLWQIELGVGVESCSNENNCEYEIKERLQVVEIYFDTPTFDKITRDAKTNDIAKLSMIGGTLGLLTGKKTVYSCYLLLDTS